MTERESRLAGYRHRRDHFFGSHPHSPLSEEQRARFRGLDYFPERPDLALTLPLDESDADIGDHLDLPTTDGRTKPFVRAGRIRFAVDGSDVTLTVLREADQGGLFIPFRDASAGTETYEFGRYLEPQVRPDGTLDVDFNYAYNPFCAYGEGWSCPIPPEENQLAVVIPAGERMFREADGEDRGDRELPG
jgi:uncharacterized protein (DUF1684 family)